MLFNSKTVCKLTDVTQRQLNDWIKKNIILPSEGNPGRGKQWLFSFVDLVQVKTATSLRREGISLQKIRKSLEYLRENFPDIQKPLAELKFLTDGKDIFTLTTDEHEILRILNTSTSQICLLVSLGDTIQHLEAEVQQFIVGTKKVVSVNGKGFLTVITPDTIDGGYVAECPELLGCFSQGETKQEAMQNIKLAIADWLHETELNRARA